MQIGNLDLQRIDFPGRAGDFQRRAALHELVAELGDNYARYHEHLRAAVDGLSRPQRGDYASVDAFLAAWADVQALVRAEAILRKCVAHRRHGRSLDAPADVKVPLVDRNDRLVSYD